MDEEIKLSVILPVYNKQNSIKPVFEILVSTIENQLSINNYEIIFVDDASNDSSQEVLRQLSHRSVIIATNIKNLGQMKTLENGLKMSKGRIIVMTSCDLQNPLREIAALYKAVNDGYDCAIAYRSERLEKGIYSSLASVFYYMLSVLFPKFPKGGFDFVAFTSNIREKLLQNDFDKMFLQLEFLRVATNIFWLPVKRDVDVLDRSSWTLKMRIVYAMKVFRYILKKQS